MWNRCRRRPWTEAGGLRRRRAAASSSSSAPASSRTLYNEDLLGPGRRDGGLLPGPLVKPARRRRPAKDSPDVAYIGEVDFDHPALAPFRDPGFAALVGPSVTFKALWEIDAAAARQPC